MIPAGAAPQIVDTLVRGHPSLRCVFLFMRHFRNNRQKFSGRRIRAQQTQEAVLRPNIRRHDLLHARPHPGKRFRHPLGHKHSVHGDHWRLRNVHGVLPPRKALFLLKLPNALIGFPVVEFALRPLTTRIVHLQRLLAEVEADLLLRHSHGQHARPFFLRERSPARTRPLPPLCEYSIGKAVVAFLFHPGFSCPDFIISASCLRRCFRSGFFYRGSTCGIIWPAPSQMSGLIRFKGFAFLDNAQFCMSSSR